MSSNDEADINLDAYDDGSAGYSKIRFRRSHTDTKGSSITTLTGDYLGALSFFGVDSVPSVNYGAAIFAVQDGAAGTYVPTNLTFSTYSSTAEHTNVLVLHNDGNVGIGTATPGSPLSVQATEGAGACIELIGRSVGDSSQIYAYSNDKASNMNIEFDARTTVSIFARIYDVATQDLQIAFLNDAAAQNDDGWATATIDYGEWMKKLNPDEKILPFEVIGIKNGKVTKNTDEATLCMITSSDSGIRGGNPIDKPREEDDNYIVVAYAGQVPVLVEGPVKEGDYLMPSGKNDGKAMAVSAEKIDFETYRKSIGIVLNIVEEDFYKDFDLENSDGGWEKELKKLLEGKGEYAIANVAVGIK